ncbi:S4 domain-containing protein YaaA [Mycobacteroides abscessus]|uniref:S4 domain-containing protein YaaA n=1 Tax=Mycobacteroides abscessus TaxID=36809 RepID=UPI000C257823
MDPQIIHIRDEYITLGQFIKFVGLVDTGGQAKVFLEEAAIMVNGESENRRGKKLYPDDRIEIEGTHSFVIARSS